MFVEKVTVRSDKAGHFTIPERFLDAEQAGLSAEKAGYLPYRGSFSRSKGAAVVLRRTANLLGRVLEHPSKQPVVGARIAVFDPRSQRPARWQTISDNDGRFRLEELAVGRQFTLLIGAQGSLPSRHALVLSTAGEVSRSFYLAGQARLMCQAFELSSGQPVADATVQALGLEVSFSRRDGTFEIGGWSDVAAGEIVTVTVAAEGYATTRRSFDATGIVPGVLERFPMIAGCFIEGRVTDDRGRPVAGAVVRVKVSESPRSDWLARELGSSLPPGTSLTRQPPVQSVTSDLDGLYRLGPLVPYERIEYVKATAKATGQVLKNGPFQLQRPGEVLRLDLAFPGLPGALAGRLTLNAEPLRARIGWRQSDGFGTAISGADGQFLVEGIPPGETVVEVSVFRPQLRRSFDLVIGAGATLHRDFALRVDTAFVSGRVINDGGLPLGGVPVVATCSGTDHAVRRQTGSDGCFRIELPPGTKAVKLMAGGPRHSVTRFNVAPGSEGLEFVQPGT